MDEQWLPITHACKFVGLPQSTYRQEVRHRIASEYFRKDGKHTMVFGPALVEAMLERDIAKITHEAPKDSAESDLEYRNKLADTRIKEAKQRKLEREELIEKSELIPLAEIMPNLTWFADRLKTFGDSLAKKNPALQKRLNDILRDGLDYWQKRAEVDD